jgi:hypothetical protein
VVNKSAICQVDAVPSMQEYYTGNVTSTVFWRWCLNVALDGLEGLQNFIIQM